MKEIKIMGGESIIITDEEAKKIASIINNAKFIELSGGDLINISYIASIREPEQDAYFMGNKMSKDKTKVFVSGEWKMFAGDINKITYRNKQNEKTKLLPEIR